MKKLILLAVMAIGLSACSNGIDVNDPNPYCWAVKIKATVFGYSQEDVQYFWCTGATIQEAIESVKEQYVGIPNTKVDISAAKSGKSESNCF